MFLLLLFLRCFKGNEKKIYKAVWRKLVFLMVFAALVAILYSVVTSNMFTDEFSTAISVAYGGVIGPNVYWIIFAPAQAGIVHIFAQHQITLKLYFISASVELILFTTRVLLESLKSYDNTVLSGALTFKSMRKPLLG